MAELTFGNIGGITEMAVAAALRRAGKYVFLPMMAPELRYDLLLEEDGAYKRIQCKTGTLEFGSVTFQTANSQFDLRSNSKIISTRHGYDGDVDYFGVHCYENGLSYLVPIHGLPTRAASLRIDPYRDKRVRNTRWAEQFEIKPKKLNREKLLAERGIEMKKELAPCITCGNNTGRLSLYCLECQALVRRKVARPTKEQLADDIASLNWVAIGEKYKVSDNAARKWARSYGLL